MKLTIVHNGGFRDTRPHIHSKGTLYQAKDACMISEELLLVKTREWQGVPPLPLLWWRGPQRFCPQLPSRAEHRLMCRPLQTVCTAAELPSVLLMLCTRSSFTSTKILLSIAASPHGGEYYDRVDVIDCRRATRMMTSNYCFCYASTEQLLHMQARSLSIFVCGRSKHWHGTAMLCIYGEMYQLHHAARMRKRKAGSFTHHNSPGTL